MNVCIFGYKRPDEKCTLNGKKCRTTCGSNVDVDVAPPTVKDVLLKRWAKDTKEMAIQTINEHTFTDGITRYGYQQAGTIVRKYVESAEDAIVGQIAYLNSAADVGM